MISVIQRCSKAKVDIKNKTVGEIGHGMVVLLGIQKDDSKEDADYLVKKLSTLRMFNDSDNKMNLSFERLFGKLINNQENMARIVSSQQGGRMIQKAAKGIVSSIFLPIGF